MRSLPALTLLLFLLPPAFARAQPDSTGTAASRLEGLPVTQLVVIGLYHLDEKVVLRRLSLQVGQPWWARTARRDEYAVAALALFWSVHILPEPDPAEGTPRGVTVRVLVQERFPWFVLPQVDWRPEEGWSGGLTGGHLNIARRGHRFFSTLMTGGTRYLSLSLSNPWNGPHHEHFRVGGALLKATNHLFGFEERGERFNGEWGRWLGRAGRLAFGFGYQRVRSDVPGVTAGDDAEDRLHFASLSLGFDTADPWAWPRLGTSGGFYLEHSGGPFGGEIDDRTLTVRLDTHQRLSERWIFAALASLDRRNGDPAFWRLLSLGGPFSIRGYPLGYYLVTERRELSAELQWELAPMAAHLLPGMGEPIAGIFLAFFMDAGRGYDLHRAPVGADLSGPTPWLLSGGLSLVFDSADLGRFAIEYARPRGERARWLFRLGTRL
jgi:outer membrane protein assembly factor BamA